MTGGNAYGKDCYDLDIVAPLTDKCLRLSQSIIPRAVISADLIIRPDGILKRKRKSISSISEASVPLSRPPDVTADTSNTKITKPPAIRPPKRPAAKVKKPPAAKITKPPAIRPPKPPAAKVSKPPAAKVNKPPALEPTAVGSRMTTQRTRYDSDDDYDNENIDANTDRFASIREQLRQKAKEMEEKQLTDSMIQGKATVADVRATFGKETVQDYNRYLKFLPTAKVRGERSRSRDRSRASTSRDERSRSRDRSRASTSRDERSRDGDRSRALAARDERSRDGDRSRGLAARNERSRSGDRSRASAARDERSRDCDRSRALAARDERSRSGDRSRASAARDERSRDGDRSRALAARDERSRDGDRSRVLAARDERSRDGDRSRGLAARDERSRSGDRSTSEDPLIQRLKEGTNDTRREVVKNAMMNCVATVSEVYEVLGQKYALQYTEILSARRQDGELGRVPTRSRSRDRSQMTWKDRQNSRKSDFRNSHIYNNNGRGYDDSFDERGRDNDRRRGIDNDRMRDKDLGRGYDEDRRNRDSYDDRRNRDSYDDRRNCDSYDDRRQDNDRRRGIDDNRRDSSHLDHAKALAVMSFANTMNQWSR